MKSRGIRLAVVALVAGGGLALIPGAIGGSAGHQASAAPVVTVYPPGTPGIVSPQPAGASPQSSTAQTKPNPRQPRRASTHATSSPALAIPVAPAPTAVGSSTLQRTFVGVGSLDSAVTNFGAEFEPPDQGLCVGNGFVIEPVNSAYRIYDTNGRSIAGPFNVNDLFNEGRTEFTSDPRCQFDPTTNTWFASILFISADNQSSHLDIAVNNTGDPTTPWRQYRVDTTSLGAPGHSGCPCFGDQPLLGIDQTNVYISTNEFSILGPDFNGAQIYAFSKADLVKVAPTHFVHFDHLDIGGGPAASVQPAVSVGTPDAEYFLNSLDPNGTLDNRIGVWAMTQRGAVAAGKSPVLSSMVIGSETYGLPPKAEQQGSSSLLDSGDDRMQATQFVAGDVWGALDTVVATSGDPTARAGAAWFRVHPSVNSTTLTGAVIGQQAYVVSPGNYLLYPAIAANGSGGAAMVVTLSGARRYASADYAVLSPGQSNFGPAHESAHGTGPYDPNAGRWGDYSWATLDPGSGSIWMATEYMPPTSFQTTDGRRNWGTRVAEVSVR